MCALTWCLQVREQSPLGQDLPRLPAGSASQLPWTCRPHDASLATMQVLTPAAALCVTSKGCCLVPYSRPSDLLDAVSGGTSGLVHHVCGTWADQLPIMFSQGQSVMLQDVQLRGVRRCQHGRWWVIAAYVDSSPSYQCHRDTSCSDKQLKQRPMSEAITCWP